MSRAEDDFEEDCVFDREDCGAIVMYDLSGEPWCRRCKDEYRAQMIVDGEPDPEIMEQ